MSAPTWLSSVFVAMMLGVAGFCTGRLVVARRTRRPVEVDSDVVHVLMGVAMAGMLIARLRFGPSAVWAVVFAGGAAWFGWAALRSTATAAGAPGWRCRQPVPHLLECGAMVYMLVAVPKPGHAMGTGGSGLSVLALGLAAFMVGYVMWLGDRFTAESATCARVLAPRCGMACKMAMGITMAYLLVLMLLTRLKLVAGFLDRGAEGCFDRERGGGHGHLRVSEVYLDAGHPVEGGEFLANRVSTVVARHPADRNRPRLHDSYTTRGYVARRTTTRPGDVRRECPCSP